MNVIIFNHPKTTRSYYFRWSGSCPMAYARGMQSFLDAGWHRIDITNWPKVVFFDVETHPLMPRLRAIAEQVVVGG